MKMIHKVGKIVLIMVIAMAAQYASSCPSLTRDGDSLPGWNPDSAGEREATLCKSSSDDPECALYEANEPATETPLDSLNAGDTEDTEATEDTEDVERTERIEDIDPTEPTEHTDLLSKIPKAITDAILKAVTQLLEYLPEIKST